MKKKKKKYLLAIINVNGHHLFECLKHLHTESFLFLFQKPLCVLDKSVTTKQNKIYKKFSTATTIALLFSVRMPQLLGKFRNCIKVLCRKIMKTVWNAHKNLAYYIFTYLEMKPPVSHFLRASVPGGKSNSGLWSTSTRTDSSACTSGRIWSSSVATISYTDVLEVRFRQFVHCQNRWVYRHRAH